MKHPENKSRDVKPKTVPNKTLEDKYDTKKPRPSIKETIQKFRADKPSNEGKLNKTRESKGDLSKGVKSTKEDTRKQKLISVIKNPEPTPRKSKVEGKASQQEAAKGNYDNSDNKKFNVLDVYKDKINSNRKGNLTKEKNTFQPSSATNKELIDKEKQLSSPQKNIDSKEKITESTPSNKPEPVSSKEEKKGLEAKEESILKQDENKQEKQPEVDMADKSEATSISSTEQQNRTLFDATQDTNEKSLYEKKFEELTNDEIHYLLDNDINHLTAVNEDYKERYSAESMGMTQEEYRAHNDRLAEANGWDKYNKVVYDESKNFSQSNNTELMNKVKRSDGGDPPPPDNPSIEKFKSKFDRENFKVEDSYDANVSQETRELVSKAYVDFIPMGGDIKLNREPKEQYSPQEVSTLKSEREKIDAPNEETIMQKIICIDTGNIEKDLTKYLNPTDLNGNSTVAQVWGFVAKAEDSAPFTKTPLECYENLRLDYHGTPYEKPNQPVYVIRFTDGKNYDIPYNLQFGGKKEQMQPTAGSGYLNNSKTLIPEYEVRPENDMGAIVTDGMIYRILPDGTETTVATFNNRDNCFELI